MEVCMIGHTLPHFPILLYLTPLPPLYVTRAHTHSRLSMRPPPPRVEFLSLSLVSLLAHGVYIIGSDLYTIYIYIHIHMHKKSRGHTSMYTDSYTYVYTQLGLSGQRGGQLVDEQTIHSDHSDHS